MGETEQHPHGFSDAWYGDYKVLRKFKQTHGENFRCVATERPKDGKTHTQRERKSEGERDGKLNATHSRT